MTTAKSKDDYCVNVCGAKCCYSKKYRCIKLDSDNRCTIYKERFQDSEPDIYIIGYYKDKKEIIPRTCMRIEYALERNLVPEDIKIGCCYAHPELLES